MSWIQIRITMDGAHAQILGKVFMACGALSVTFEDAKDTPLFEPLPGETPLWPETDVIGLFGEDIEVSAIVEELTGKAGSLLKKNFHYEIERIEDQAWERVCMDNFHPMRFGQRLWICPSWCEAPEPEAVNIKLDPGLAFGTGSHPTTALCLEWLDSLDLRGKTIIDFGCGSGILAIAALKLGARNAIGIDIDPQAIQASRNNAENNDVAERLSLFLSQNIPNEIQADVVVANILSGPLRELSPQISSFVKKGGQLCLSGILSHQAESVSSTYAPNFLLDPSATREEWCRITGVRLTHHFVDKTN